MGHWATAPLDRLQVTVFAPTLDDSLADDHPVRLFDETLRTMDFTAWESQYVRVVGQPPIHPRLLAGLILYGLSLGIRSSRKLEDACLNRLDFIWLMEGRCPDHSTICGFRTQHGQQLKDLFKQIGRVAIEMGLITLNQVALDGTAIHGNASRFKTARRATIEEKLQSVDKQVEQLMAQAAEQDQVEDQLYGQETSPSKLPKELSDIKRRQAKLKAALDHLKHRDKENAEKGTRNKAPAVARTDPDARVLPNKGGGFGPNYTPVLAVDGSSGMVVDVQVLSGNNEVTTVLPAVDNIEQNFGEKPRQMLADSGFNNGPNLAGLHERGVEALMPAKIEMDASVAERSDPTEPVAKKSRVSLPIHPGTKILDKSAFIFDESKDCYYCPNGKRLDYVEDKPYQRVGSKGTYRIYESPSCDGCPMSRRCLPRNATVRRVSRDEYEHLRKEMSARMKSESGKKSYNQRGHIAETPFAVLKTAMNFRQFLLRGLAKVTMETYWAVTSYNMGKLMRAIAAERAVPAMG
jgi:transposase